MDIAPLISVIVPIYNVEKYVRKCLDSLRNQTMKQIEVICIDDGSTDKSGAIADEYASQDWPTFRIIHTENRGLSAARNRGIDEARADWLMFVDSDDWVHEDFCRVPYEKSIEYGADLVCFGTYRVTGQGITKKAKKDCFEGIVERKEAIDNIGATTWNKLYRKDVFNNIRYPEGHFYEDIGTTHKLIYRSNQILKIQHCLYYYRYRRGSIANSSIGVDDILEMGKQRYEDMLKVGYPKEKAYSQLLESALRYCGKSQNKESLHYQEAVNIVKEGSTVPLIGMTKIKKRLFCFNRSFYRFIYRLAMHIKDVVYR